MMYYRVRLFICLVSIAVDAQRDKSDCGTEVGRGIPTIVNGVAAKYGTFPWHVGVYLRTWEGTYGHICGGTLISSDIVISAAHCFHDETRGQIQDARKFKIAAGKYYRDYDSPNDPYVQKSSVKSIDIPEKYIGYSGNYGADIALVRVETPFSTTALVKPVCVHWDIIDGSEHPLSGQIGKVVGWGVTETTEPSEVLKEIDLPFVPYDNCSATAPVDFQPFITPQDKFCAGYLNGSSVCGGDSGGGLCFEHRGLWYLRGIVSNIPRGNTDLGCDNNQYAAFTNVDSFLRWIYPAFDGTRIATNGCTLPNQPKSGSFKLTCHGECDGVPGSVVPRGSVLVYHCEKEHILKGNGVSRCGISGWNSLPTCIKACPPLASSHKDTGCEFGGKSVSCRSLMAPGTTAYLACPTFYMIAGTDNTTITRYSDQLTCLDGGEWDGTTLQCVPECGKVVDSDDQFKDTPEGNPHLPVAHPWVVVISQYKYPSEHDTTGLGGTLIQPDLVLSVMLKKYFFDDNGQRRDINNFEVRAGHFHNFNMPGYFSIELSKVESFNYVEDSERQSTVPLATGLVLLRLATPFVLSDYVKPICIDWDNRLVAEQLREGNVGKVPKHLVGTNSSINGMSRIDFTYLPRENCNRLLRKVVAFTVTTAEFCAHTLSTNLDPSADDTLLRGFGISFKSDNRWFLRGAMLGYFSRDQLQQASNRTYSAFTNIGNFLGWIRAAYGDGSGCILPEEQEGGKFELASCQEACNADPGSRVPTGSVLFHRCDQGWKLEGNEISECGKTKWDSFPKCIKQCPSLVSPSVDMVCKYEGERSPCGSYLAPGTMASLFCKDFYKISGPRNSTNYEITCLDGGEWDRPTLQCIPECGKTLDSEDQFYDTPQKKTQYELLPWAVEIRLSGPLGDEQISIFGTLIQPDLVLSVWELPLFRDDDGKLRDIKNFKVYAGQSYNLNTTEYFHQQRSNISSFSHVNDREILLIGRSFSGLVLIRLATPFVMSTYVRPVCMDWDNRLVAEQLREGNVGKVPKTDSWTDEESVHGDSSIDYTYLPRKNCQRLMREERRNLITAVEFCAHALTKTAANTDGRMIRDNLLPGLGISFKSDGLWYLRGVLSFYFLEDALLDVSASNRTYTIFINVGNFLEWIRSAYGDVSGCILPEQHKDGKFELLSCPGTCNTQPGSRVPTGSVLIHRCNEESKLEGRETSKCGNTEWDSLPKCIKQCLPLVSASVEMVCKYYGERSSCGSHIPPGTTASLLCKEFYKISGNQKSTDDEMTCLDGGEWDRPPTLECVPECGKFVDSKEQFFDAGVRKVKFAALPWAVMIHRHVLPGEDAPKHLFGALIQPDLVLSVLSKHYFWDGNGQRRDIETFTVLAGIYHDINTTKYTPVEFSKVESFDYMEDTQLERMGRPVAGPVLLRLAMPFKLSTYIRPVCIDWGNRLVAKQLVKGNVGKAPRTWFDTKEASVNGDSGIDYTFLPRDECQRLIRKPYQVPDTTVEFCGHTLNTPTNTSEDDRVFPGLGISFESDGLWYLRGLLDGHFRNDSLVSASNMTLVTFINVGNFLEWIRAAYGDVSIHTLPDQQKEDCTDRSDEMTEKCTKCDPMTQFECKNKKCLPKSWRCDSDDDCGDGSDEAEVICNPGERHCPQSRFQCGNTLCILMSETCDGSNDCGDNSDESPAMCGEQPKPSPRGCPCENGGVCRKNDEGDLACACPIEFHGEHCEIERVAARNGGNTAVIVIPIVVAILLLLGATAVFVFRKKLPCWKPGGLVGLTRTQSMVFPRGNNVEFGRAVPEKMELLDVTHNLNDINNRNRDLNEPMYDSVNADQTGTINCTSTSGTCEVSVEMKPSSIQHKEVLQSHLVKRELDPSPVHSGTDKQHFGKEDESDRRL